MRPAATAGAHRRLGVSKDVRIKAQRANPRHQAARGGIGGSSTPNSTDTTPSIWLTTRFASSSQGGTREALLSLTTPLTVRTSIGALPILGWASKAARTWAVIEASRSLVQVSELAWPSARLAQFARIAGRP